MRRLVNAVLQPGFAGRTAPDWLRRSLADGLGGVLLWDRNIADAQQLAELTAQLRAENPDVLICVDEEGGDVTRLETASGSSWPSSWALGVVDDAELTRAVAHEIGRDLAAAGVSLNYAPVADVNSNPHNPVIGTRSFGADPWRVAAHAAAFVTGLQAAGVAACAKHFPGHGDTSVDSHRGLPVVHDDAATLSRGALVPFRAAIAAGVKAIMSAHIVVSRLDAVPATLSRRVLTELLRKELGFDGLVVTDAIEMAAIKATYGLAEGAVRAIAAGADVVCIGGWRDAEATIAHLGDALETAVREGRLSEARLAEAAARARRVTAWAAERAAAPADGPQWPGDRAIGLDAARRALRTKGTPAPLTGPPHVVELSPVVNAQIGDGTGWGIASALAAVLPGTTSQRLDEKPSDPNLITAAANGRRLVIVVRDAHRHEWMASTLRDLLEIRPDSIVVEMGLPYGDLPAVCGWYLATHGAGHVSAAAAVEVLCRPV
jgi:beta-N-acetylhexosaminidase